MDRVREIAFMCVGRAVFFGSIAIGCIMIGSAYDPVMAFRFGAITTMLMAGMLTWKALAAPSQKPKRTEVWLYLDEQQRPRNEHAERAFADVLRETYILFAKAAFGVACLFFMVSVGLASLGLGAHGFGTRVPVLVESAG